MEHGNLDNVLEALENFEVRFPDLDTETKLFFVLGGMSAGEVMWTSMDILEVIKYFIPTMKGEDNEKSVWGV